MGIVIPSLEPEEWALDLLPTAARSPSLRFPPPRCTLHTCARPAWRLTPLWLVHIYAAAQLRQLLFQQLQVGVHVAQLQGDRLSDPGVAGGSGRGRGRQEDLHLSQLQ